MRGFIPFGAGAVLALAAGWIAFPYAIYRAKPQPVDFSHQVHIEKAGVKCEDCHAFRDDGSYAGVPTLDKCAGCHSAPMGTTQAEKNFIDQYVTPNREPAWFAYARQPENVFFSHAAHVKLAGLKCEQCHGAAGAAAHLRVYQQDRISGYSRDVLPVAGQRHSADMGPGMSMDDCVACHRQRGLEHSCLECHK
jgi:menaquinone reductase, multiheme cytochrome c subunit